METRSKQENKRVGSYTPGPWQAIEFSSPRGSYYVVNENNGDLIFGAGRSICEANAHLIAAAPELLDALRDTVQALKGYVEDDGGPEWVYKALDEAKAAIAKAEGAP